MIVFYGYGRVTLRYVVRVCGAICGHHFMVAQVWSVFQPPCDVTRISNPQRGSAKEGVEISENFHRISTAAIHQGAGDMSVRLKTNQ